MSSATDFQPLSAIVVRAYASVGVGPDLIIARQPDPGFDRSVSVASLNAAVTEAVRQVIDHPVFGSGANDVSRRDPGRDDDAEGEQTSVADAVIAAHDTRIQLLKARIEALRSAGGSLPLIADLGVRLRRAEAARRLATARADLGQRSGSCDVGAVPSICPPNLTSTAPVADADADRHAPAPVHRPARDRSLSNGWTAAEPASRHPRPHLAAWTAQASCGPWSRGRPGIGRTGPDGPLLSAPASLTRWSFYARPLFVRAAIGGPVARRLTPCRRTASRLAAARRSLATARRLLEGEGARRVRPISVPATMLAGLLRWDGSETWTLSSIHAG